jgi:hypothetical protein
MTSYRHPANPPAGPISAGNAAQAARLLDKADVIDDRAQIRALQGIGYALLAIADQLADATDTAADIAAHLKQLAMTADELASPPPIPRRAWLRPRRRAKAAPGAGNTDPDVIAGADEAGCTGCLLARGYARAAGASERVVALVTCPGHRPASAPVNGGGDR